jgi:hypothetical protein
MPYSGICRGVNSCAFAREINGEAIDPSAAAPPASVVVFRKLRRLPSVPFARGPLLDSLLMCLLAPVNIPQRYDHEI